MAHRQDRPGVSSYELPNDGPRRGGASRSIHPQAKYQLEYEGLEQDVELMEPLMLDQMLMKQLETNPD